MSLYVMGNSDEVEQESEARAEWSSPPSDHIAISLGNTPHTNLYIFICTLTNAVQK